MTTGELRGFMKAESEAIVAFAEIGTDASVHEQAVGMLETKRLNLKVQFYAVSLMSLEQIFIDMSGQQFEEE